MQAAFFATLMSDAWASGCPSGGSAVEFVIDIEDTEIELEAFRIFVDFLYGVPPGSMSWELVEPLLAVGTYFGLAQLCSFASEFAFSNMSKHNCTSLSKIGSKDFGTAGRLVAGAATAFLLRNAVDVAELLSDLDLKTQARRGIMECNAKRTAQKFMFSNSLAGKIAYVP